MMQPPFTNKKYYVYKITNLINGKIYIGKSNTNKNRWKDHLNIAKNKYPNTYKYVHKSINKYGANNFTYEVLEYFDDEDLSYEAEMKYVTLFNSNNSKYGMNLDSGGAGGKQHNEESIEKIRSWHTGIKYSDESKNKMSQSHIGQIPGNKKISDDMAQHIKEYYLNKRSLKIKDFKIINELAEKYECSTHCIKGVLFGKNYKHIKAINVNTIPDGFKYCSKCNELKLLLNFNKQSNTKDGCCNRCRDCEREYTKARLLKRKLITLP